MTIIYSDISLVKIAQSEAEVWEDSPYYKQAEDWTWLFWNNDHPFRQLFNKLDLTNLLELACGRGRHAEYALEHFSSDIGKLTMMDILESNISYCCTRPLLCNNASILTNNGADFRPIDKSSLTAIYCYDAMVHFNHEVVKSYLKDSFRVLVPGGRALFHHSNYSSDSERHFGQNPNARAFMSAGLFRTYAEESGLKICEQIIYPWGGIPNLDCISLVEKLGD